MTKNGMFSSLCKQFSVQLLRENEVVSLNGNKTSYRAGQNWEEVPSHREAKKDEELRDKETKMG